MPTPRKIISPDGHTCRVCKTFQPWTNFAKDSHKWYGKRDTCRGCSRANNQRFYSAHVEESAQRAAIRYATVGKHEIKDRYQKHHARFLAQRDKYWETPRGRMMGLLSSAKDRARKKHLPFTLTIQWLMERYTEQDGACLLTGTPFDMKRREPEAKGFGYKALSPSLDRIDSKRGYTPDNVRLVCTAANLAINHFGDELFEPLVIRFLRKRGYEVTRRDV